VLKRLRDEFVQHGRLEHFNRLKVYLLDQGEVPYAELAHQLETSEGALKVAIHRFRKRYRDLLRAEIAETVNDASQVDGELRYLAGALAGK
jgi:RNA polymerase sigma-70 factor (ECF subfamily)